MSVTLKFQSKVHGHIPVGCVVTTFMPSFSRNLTLLCQEYWGDSLVAVLMFGRRVDDEVVISHAHVIRFKAG
jgi:hypothetical protein